MGAQEFAVIHHTDCGMLTFTNGDVRSKLGPDAEGIDFLPFSDSAQSVQEDVERVRCSPLIPDGTPVSGYIYMWVPAASTRPSLPAENPTG